MELTVFILLIFINACFMLNQNSNINGTIDVVKVSLDLSKLANTVDNNFLSITLSQSIFNRTRDIRKHFLFR